MPSGYTTVADGSDGNGANVTLYLYPFRDRDTSELEGEITDAVKNMCQQLINRDDIGSYDILQHDTAVIDDSNWTRSDFQFLPAFSDWIDNNKPYTGCHMVVTDENNLAGASRVYVGESSWITQGHAFVGTAGGYAVGNSDEDRYSNLAIQEPLHELIVPYQYVQDLVDGDLPEDSDDDGDYKHEHELGQIYAPQELGPSSPMLTFYEHDNAHPSSDLDCSRKGDCQMSEYASGWNEEHSQALTSCTLKAAEYCADEETNNYL